MKRSVYSMIAAVLLGAAAALGGGLGRFLPDWAGINAPVRLLGNGLRSLSLSGFIGNLAAWAVVLAVSALPLLLLRWRSRGREDGLVWLTVPMLLMGQYFMVNPSQLNTPLRDMFPLLVVETALSLLAAWWLLGWLRRMKNGEEGQLTASFRSLFRVCALLLVFTAAYGQLAALLADWERIAQGNTGYTGRLGLTYGVLVLLTALRFIPDLLAGLALLWGGELAGALEGGFDGMSVELCRRAASACAMAARVTVLAAAGVNVLQLVLIEWLRDASFQLEIPLLTLALSAGLYLLCRILERGRQLQEDSDSII